MTSRSAIILLLSATVGACGGSSLDPAGTAGSAGTAASSAGTTGTAGTVAGGTGGGGSGGTVLGGTGGGGTGGSELAACGITTPPEAAVSVQLDGSDDKPVAAPVTASVTVASVESCTMVTCPNGGGLGMQKIVLTAVGPKSWTLYFYNSAMPTDLIKVGDTYDMIVEAGIVQSGFGGRTNQTIVLAHGADLVVFAADLGKFGAPPLPMLSAFGVGVADLGPRCETPGQCTERPHNALVTVGSESASVLAARTVQVGWLSFTNGTFLEYVDHGFCDAMSRTQVAGFRGVPPPACGGAQVTSGLEFTIVGADGVAVATDVSAAVTIASVDSCATVSCAWAYPADSLSPTGSSTTATRFIMTAGSNQQWTLYLRLPDLPSGLVAPGDAFDLSVHAGKSGGPYVSVYQTAVLARGGQLSVFASNLMGLSGDPPFPPLDSYGIAIRDGGVLCQTDVFSCGRREHAVRATVGSETAVAAPGQTVRVGDFSFTNDLAVDFLFPGWGCHRKPASLLGGFMRQTTLQSRL